MRRAPNSPLSFRLGERLNKCRQRPSDETSTDVARIVVSENVSLDGIAEDPTGEEGFARGGWFGQIKDHQYIVSSTLEDPSGTSRPL